VILVAGILALLCVVFGLWLLIFPNSVMRVSRVTDKKYSSDGLKELLNKQISIEKLGDILEKYNDINSQLFKFGRVIGLLAVVVGIILFFIYLTL
jgi:hypothetical protein